MSSQSANLKKPPKLREVFWFEQRLSDVPEHDLWLGKRELAKLSELRFAKRRSDWRLGRWTTKCALASYLKNSHSRETLSEIEIVAANDGAPEAWIGGQTAPAAISISHSNGIALTVVGCAQSPLGCDLEQVAPRSEGFLSDYFTAKEQIQFRFADRSLRPLLANLFWSAKESALKALRTGLRQDTRSLSVVLTEEFAHDREWHLIEVQSCTSAVFSGWWREERGMLRTIVGQDPSSLPQPLNQ